LPKNLFNRKSQKELRTTLRREQPEAEKLLWWKPGNRGFLGYKFRRQYGIENYKVNLTLTLSLCQGEGKTGTEPTHAQIKKLVGGGAARFGNLLWECEEIYQQ
jgi:hypothetical protein